MDYTDPTQSDHHGVGDGIDMDMVHDFGEGVGLDMRDFQSHDVDDRFNADGDNDPSKHLVLDPSLTGTPMNQTLKPEALTPHPPSSMNNGSHEPPSVNMDDMFHTETGLDDDDDDDDGDETPDGTSGNKRARHNDVPGGFTYVDKDGEPGRRKIRIEYISDKSRRHITFSKRKAGIMKKAYELSILTGTQVLLLVVSETGLVYTFTTTKLQPMVQKPEGKNLIQACLTSKDGLGPDGQPLPGPLTATKSKNGGLAIRPHKLSAAAISEMDRSAAASASANQEAQALHHQQQQQQHLQSPHQQQQLEAAAQIGQGSAPSTSAAAAARPKKRLPSGKGKKAQAAAAAAAAGDMPTQPDQIPPVPSIPDMHRPGGGSPQQQHQQQQTPTLMSIPSPYGHLPPDAYHQHQASPTQANFFHSPGGGHHQQPPPGGADYGYYTGHPHQTYMMHQAPPPMAYGDSRQRMMMEGRNMQGMGYAGGPGHGVQGDM